MALPAMAALILGTAAAAATVVVAPTAVPARWRKLSGFFHPVLPLYQLLVAAALGWGVVSLLAPMLVTEGGTLGAGLPVMFARACIAGAGGFGALLAGLSQTRAAVAPDTYAVAA